MRKYQRKAYREYGFGCQLCDSDADVVHHIDGDRDNDDIDNLMPLCGSCHARVHVSKDSVPGVSDRLPDSAFTLSANAGRAKTDGGAKQYTSITVEETIKDRLAADKPDDMSWSEYLSVLHSDQEIVVENVAAGGGVNYDDVKEACRAAIREELPVGEMGR